MSTEDIGPLAKVLRQAAGRRKRSRVEVWLTAFGSAAIGGMAIVPATSVVGALPPAGSYAGLFQESDRAPDRSGAVALTINNRGIFTGSLSLGPKRYPFHGQFDSTAKASSTVTRRGGASLNVALDATGGNGQISGSIGDGQWQADLLANRAGFNARTHPATQYAGTYTLRIPGNLSAASTIPGGDGYAALSVSASGRVILGGALADGTLWSQAASLAENGDCPLYISRNAGSVLGWLHFGSNAPATGLQGTLSWIKASDPKSHLYPAGFTNTTTAAGFRYIPPTRRGDVVVQWTRGVVTLEGGDLPQPLTNAMAFSPANKIIDRTGTNRLSFSLTSSKGVFRGTITPAGTKNSIKMQGVFLQGSDAGFGYFLGSTESGLVSLHSLSGPPVYPLKKSANGRYLVDQNGSPFMIAGDSPQSLIVNLTEADAAAFFANRKARAFNTLWINLLCTVTGGRPDGSTWDGILPFTGTLGSPSYDLSKPNEAYFAHVDRVLNLAAQQGLLVLLDPIETGGWLTTLLDNGTSRCYAYGQYLGNRYKDFDNILWMSGNDFQTWMVPANDDVVRAVALGIKSVDPNHIHTVELNYMVSSSLDDASWAPIIGLNATYTYSPTYAQLLLDYGRTNFLPNFMVEANYEFENAYNAPNGGNQALRRQEYWTMLSGAAGQLYGNGYTWPFIPGWQNFLDTPGAIQFGYMVSLFRPRAWFDLIPDAAHRTVTAGYGTFTATGSVNDSDYATAAGTADGTLLVAYMPTVRTLTVDMSQLNGSVTAHWYDPANGAYLAVSGSPFSNTGSRNFTPAGNNSSGDGDWVLVLETQPP